MGTTATELARLLADRALDLCRELFPNGKRSGNSWIVGNIDGDEGKSMKIGISGERLGQWKDFGEADMSGDFIGLIKAVKSYTIRQAWEYAADFLQIPHGKDGRVKPRKEYYRPQPKIEPTKEELSDPFNYLINKRKLSLETLEIYKVYTDGNKMCFPCYACGNSQQNNDICYCITNISILRDSKGKKICDQDCDRNPDPEKRLTVEFILFGWQALSGNEREIIICEGQIDAMSWYEYGWKALSVPAGANNLTWIENDFDRLAVFDTIYINMDGDEEGKKATVKIIERLGAERCRIISLPHKDINECLQKNIPQEQIDELVKRAAFCDPIDIKRPNDFREKVWERYYPAPESFLGILPPWRKAQVAIRFRPAELSIWLGYSGAGKSQLLGQILLATIDQHKKVCIASMELTPDNFLYKLSRQATGGLITPSRGYYDKVIDIFHENIYIFEKVGTAKTESLLSAFEYAHKRYGVDQFLIDSLMKLSIAEDDYNAQKAFIERLCDFKNKYKVHVHLITHSRKRMNENESPSKMDAKGTGAITDLADNVFIIWRNKPKEILLNKRANNIELSTKELAEFEGIRKEADTFLKCEKQRNGDYEGIISLYFHRQSFQFVEYESESPKIYI
jgi:twinkle protein